MASLMKPSMSSIQYIVDSIVYISLHSQQIPQINKVNVGLCCFLVIRQCEGFRKIHPTYLHILQTWIHVLRQNSTDFVQKDLTRHSQRGSLADILRFCAFRLHSHLPFAWTNILLLTYENIYSENGHQQLHTQLGKKMPVEPAHPKLSGKIFFGKSFIYLSGEPF